MLRIVPVTLKQANAFVALLHRHCEPVQGYKFAIGCAKGEVMVGVAIVGRVVSRELQEQSPLAAEITRNCTDGTRNACSMLYGAARRAARAMGHAPVYTYSLPQEGGASLRAAGFRLDREFSGGTSKDWRRRHGEAKPVGDDLVGGKWRWIG
jgi:hypothetical protein